MTPLAKLILRSILEPAIPQELEGVTPLLLLGTAAANTSLSHLVALKSLRTPMEPGSDVPLSIFGIRPSQLPNPEAYDFLLYDQRKAAQACRKLYPSKLPPSLREWAHLHSEIFPGMSTPEGFMAAYRRLVAGPEFL